MVDKASIQLRQTHGFNIHLFLWLLACVRIELELYPCYGAYHGISHDSKPTFNLSIHWIKLIHYYGDFDFIKILFKNLIYKSQPPYKCKYHFSNLFVRKTNTRWQTNDEERWDTCPESRSVPYYATFQVECNLKSTCNLTVIW